MTPLTASALRLPEEVALDREPKAFLFLVNPTLAYDPYPDWARWIPQLAAGETIVTTWNTGTRRQGIKPGDCGVVVKVGTHPKGAIGFATVTSEIWIGPHWNPEAKRTETGFVDVQLDALLPVDEPIPLTELKSPRQGRHCSGARARATGRCSGGVGEPSRVRRFAYRGEVGAV